MGRYLRAVIWLKLFFYKNYIHVTNSIFCIANFYYFIKYMFKFTAENFNIASDEFLFLL